LKSEHKYCFSTYKLTNVSLQFGAVAQILKYHFMMCETVIDRTCTDGFTSRVGLLLMFFECFT